VTSTRPSSTTGAKVVGSGRDATEAPVASAKMAISLPKGTKRRVPSVAAGVVSATPVLRVHAACRG
jgi:hypothetical protein